MISQQNNRDVHHKNDKLEQSYDDLAIVVTKLSQLHQYRSTTIEMCVARTMN